MEIWQNIIISLVGGGGVATLFLSLYISSVARKISKEEIASVLKEFTSKEEMQVEKEKLLKEVERKFLTIYAFREFEKRIDENFRVVDRRFEDTSKRFDKVDDGIEHLKDLVIQLIG